jgi:hypothetical protein
MNFEAVFLPVNKKEKMLLFFSFHFAYQRISHWHKIFNLYTIQANNRIAL